MLAEGTSPWADWPYRTLCFLKGKDKEYTLAKVITVLLQKAAEIWRTLMQDAVGIVDSMARSWKTLAILSGVYGFGSFTAYQAAINISYFFRGLHDPSVHACAAQGTITALQKLYPMMRVTGGQDDVVTALVRDVRDLVKKDARRLFEKRARDWSLQPAEHSLCAWNRLETGACRRRRRA